MAKIAKRENIMLAYPAEEKRILRFPLMEQEDGTKKRMMFHQPKLNGERGRVEWFNDMPYIFSSYGNDFRFIEHIQKQLLDLAMLRGKAENFDGEIYVHGWPRERIDSALRRTKNRNRDSAELQFHIFDIQDNESLQFQRLHTLGTVDQVLASARNEFQHLHVVEYGICDETTWLPHCANYIEDRYEGIILRNPLGKHITTRTVDLLKFKPTETDKYEIVGVNEAISKDGQYKGMVGSFTVRATDEPGENITFDVGAGKLPHAKRIEYFARRDECVGKFLLVKHELLRTRNSVPIAAVTVDIIDWK